MATTNEPNPLVIKVILREPLRSLFIAMRDHLAEDNTGLGRLAIREYLDNHPSPTPEAHDASDSAAYPSS